MQIIPWFLLASKIKARLSTWPHRHTHSVVPLPSHPFGHYAGRKPHIFASSSLLQSLWKVCSLCLAHSSPWRRPSLGKAVLCFRFWKCSSLCPERAPPDSRWKQFSCLWGLSSNITSLEGDLTSLIQVTFWSFLTMLSYIIFFFVFCTSFIIFYWPFLNRI